MKFSEVMHIAQRPELSTHLCTESDKQYNPICGQPLIRYPSWHETVRYHQGYFYNHLGSIQTHVVKNNVDCMLCLAIIRKTLKSDR